MEEMRRRREELAEHQAQRCRSEAERCARLRHALNVDQDVLAGKKSVARALEERYLVKVAELDAERNEKLTKRHLEFLKSEELLKNIRAPRSKNRKNSAAAQ